MYPYYGPPTGRCEVHPHSLTLPRPPSGSSGQGPGGGGRPHRALRQHKSFHHHPRRVPGGATALPYGYGAPWRTKYEFYPAAPGTVSRGSPELVYASSGVRRHHSVKRPPPPSRGSPVAYHRHPVQSHHMPVQYPRQHEAAFRSVSPPINQRQRAGKGSNVVFGRSRDDASIEKTSPMRDIFAPGFRDDYIPHHYHSHPGDPGEAEEMTSFSFASAMRSEGTPTRMLKESLVRGSQELYKGIRAEISWSQSQLHRASPALPRRRPAAAATDIKKSKSFSAKELSSISVAARSRSPSPVRKPATRLQETTLDIHQLIMKSEDRSGAVAAVGALRVSSSSEREFECKGCGERNVVKKSKSIKRRSRGAVADDEELEIRAGFAENFRQFRPRSRARELNNEEIAKLAHFRRFFSSAGIGEDDLVRTVSLIRARMREEERKAVDEYGMPTTEAKIMSSRR